MPWASGHDGLNYHLFVPPCHSTVEEHSPSPSRSHLLPLVLHFHGGVWTNFDFLSERELNTSTPFFEVWGWHVVAGTAKAKFLEFIANHFVFNSLITGDWKVLKDALRHLVLPVIALSTIPMAIIARMTRSSLLEVLGRDYVRTARAKGAKERRVVARHALRNALLPVVTILGLQMGALLGGAVLTETVFGLAGVGRMLFEAITARDYPIIQAFTVVIAVAYMLINLIVDVSYGFLDPRIRLE